MLNYRLHAVQWSRHCAYDSLPVLFFPESSLDDAIMSHLSLSLKLICRYLVDNEMLSCHFFYLSSTLQTWKGKWIEGVDHISEPPDGICCLLQRVVFFWNAHYVGNRCDKLVLVPVGSRKTNVTAKTRHGQTTVERPTQRFWHTLPSDDRIVCDVAYLPWSERGATFSKLIQIE